MGSPGGHQPSSILRPPAGVVRARAIISGRVQGVFFRQTAASEARARGVAGSVRNLEDGTVEVIVQGPRGAVASMLDWCRTGPPAASVVDVEVDWLNAQHDPREFSIL